MKNFLNKLFLFIILSTNISFLNSTFANEVKEIIVKGARIDTSEDNFGSSIFILDSEETVSYTHLTLPTILLV